MYAAIDELAQLYTDMVHECGSMDRRTFYETMTPDLTKHSKSMLMQCYSGKPAREVIIEQFKRVGLSNQKSIDIFTTAVFNPNTYPKWTLTYDN
jgi:hypothetical protein